jgi:hypothetical protein
MIRVWSQNAMLPVQRAGRRRTDVSKELHLTLVGRHRGAYGCHGGAIRLDWVARESRVSDYDNLSCILQLLTDRDRPHIMHVEAFDVPTRAW